jgi:hypothetical protein
MNKKISEILNEYLPADLVDYGVMEYRRDPEAEANFNKCMNHLFILNRHITPSWLDLAKNPAYYKNRNFYRIFFYLGANEMPQADDDDEPFYVLYHGGRNEEAPPSAFPRFRKQQIDVTL